MKTYTTYSDKFKSKVAIEAIKNEKTLNELSKEFNVPKKNIQNWKKEFIENAEIVFNRKKTVKKYKEKLELAEKEKDKLHRKIGELIVLNEWAEKKIKEYGL